METLGNILPTFYRRLSFLMGKYCTYYRSGVIGPAYPHFFHCIFDSKHMHNNGVAFVSPRVTKHVRVRVFGISRFFGESQARVRRPTVGERSANCR